MVGCLLSSMAMIYEKGLTLDKRKVRGLAPCLLGPGWVSSSTTATPHRFIHRYISTKLTMTCVFYFNECFLFSADTVTAEYHQVVCPACPCCPGQPSARRHRRPGSGGSSTRRSPPSPTPRLPPLIGTSCWTRIRMGEASMFFLSGMAIRQKIKSADFLMYILFYWKHKRWIRITIP